MAKFPNPFTKIKDAFWEDENVLKIRQQFSELDPKIQSGIMIGVSGLGLLAMMGLLGFLFNATLMMRAQIKEIDDSIRYLQQSSEKMDELNQKIRAQKSQNDDIGVSPGSPLTEVVEKVAGKSNIAKEAVEMPESVSSPALEVKINRISLRQLVRFLFYLENSNADAQTSKLIVDARDDKEGYLWATIHLSRSTMSNKK